MNIHLCNTHDIYNISLHNSLRRVFHYSVELFINILQSYINYRCIHVRVTCTKITISLSLYSVQPLQALKLDEIIRTFSPAWTKHKKKKYQMNLFFFSLFYILSSILYFSLYICIGIFFSSFIHMLTLKCTCEDNGSKIQSLAINSTLSAASKANTENVHRLKYIILRI